MRIALVTPGGVDRSGTERVIPCLLWLIERLVRGGHDVHVFAFDQEQRPGCWPLLGATVHNAGARPRALRLWRALAIEHRRARFDVMHCFWALPSGAAMALPALLLRIPMVLTLPGGDLVADRTIDYGGRRRWRDRVRIALTTRIAARVTTPSRPMVDAARLLGIEAMRVPLGVARDHWPAAAPRPRLTGAPLHLVHVASLNRVKDQETLLRAMAALRDHGLDFELAIVGEDTLDGAVQRRSAALSLAQHVRFTGFLPQPALRAELDHADLLVMTSRHEGAPIAMLEAAMAGVPTIGTAVGHIAEFTPEAAVAVAVGDAAALAQAIARAAADEPERLRLAQAAQARALEIDADHTARAFLDMYRALAPERSAASHVRVARTA